MRVLLMNALLLGTALSLAACGNESKAEDTIGKGQVVANLNGDDITVYELNTELQGLNLPSGEARKQVEQAALQRVIDRKILANIAKERGLDKTPNFILQQRRGNEALLVQLLEQDMAGKIPPVSDEDAEKYIAANPTLFADRKLLMIDQLQFPLPANREALKEFEPLKTLEEIERKLTMDGIEFRRLPSTIDTGQLPRTTTETIMALPAGEVFVVPMSGMLTANRITETRSAPVTGGEAIQKAKAMVRNQRLQEKAKAEFEPLLKEAKAKVRYQDGFAPPKADAAAAPAGPTAANP